MANSGVIFVTELRKFVNGVDTGQVKPNVVGDPDYIAPYLDTLTCLPNTSAVTTTTAAPTTTTTTTLNYKSFLLSTNVYNSTTASCASTDPGINRFFLGSGSFPVVNDMIYTDSAGQNLLSTNIYYSPTRTSAYSINSGKVISITTCSAPPVASPVAPPPTAPTYNYYFMRTCPTASTDIVVRTTSVFTIGSGSTNSTTTSVFGTCYYAYNNATESEYYNNAGDAASQDVTGQTTYSGCAPCQGTPTPVAVTCYNYVLTGPSGYGAVTFTYTACGGSSTDVTLPSGQTQTVCAEINSVTMSPSTGTIVADSTCS